MKKLLFIFLAFTFVKAEAQNDSTKFVQKINAGAIFGSTASTTFTGGSKPFNLGYNLYVNTCVITPKTYHSILYGFGSNSISSLNGYFLNNGWDTYIVYAKTLNTTGNYLGVGIEKMIKIETKANAEPVRIFLLSEFGTNFKGNKILSFGLLMSFQNRIWVRK